MTSYKPAIHVPVTVTISNKWIDFRTSATYAIGIQTGTYTNLWSLASAVQTAFNNSTATVTVSCTLGSANSVYGKLYIDGNKTMTLLWASGTHSASNAHTILGFSAVNTSAASNHYSTYQMPGAWFSTRAPASDTYDRKRSIGGKGRETLSGVYYKRVTVGKVRYRNVSFELIPDENVLARAATGTNTNRDFETVWATIVDGQSFLYYGDQTSSTSDGTYYLMKPDTMEDIKRPHPEAEIYSFALEMMRKES